MKKIITIIAIVFSMVVCCYGQTKRIGDIRPMTIHFDNGKYDLILHPNYDDFLHKETITLASYDAISQKMSFKQVEIEYEIVNPQRMMYENRKMINNFAATELIGIGVGAVGGIVSYVSAEKGSEFGSYIGIGLAVAGGVTCIVGYIPLLKGTDMYVTENGIGIRYKIKSK